MREVCVVRPCRDVRLMPAPARRWAPIHTLWSRLVRGATPRTPLNPPVGGPALAMPPARRWVFLRGVVSWTVVFSSVTAVHPMGNASTLQPALATWRAQAFAQIAKERRAQVVLHQKLRRLAGVWANEVEQASRQARVDPVLVAAVLHTENQGFIDDCASRVSSAGAIGPMQLRPGTAVRQLHVDPWDPRQNIQGGAIYLGHLIRRFGSVRKALVAYNAGPTALTLGRASPESWQYADKVLAFMSEADQAT